MSHYLILVKLLHAPNVQSLYLLSGTALAPTAVARMANELLHDPVVQRASWHNLDSWPGEPVAFPTGGCALEISCRPGVTDNEAESVLLGAQRLGLEGLETVRTLRRHILPYSWNSPQAARSAQELANDVIQTTLLYGPETPPDERLAFYRQLLLTPVAASVSCSFLLSVRPKKNNYWSLARESPGELQ